MGDKVFSEITNNIFQFNDQYFFSEKVGTYLINLPDKILLFDLPTYSKGLSKILSDLLVDKEFIAILSHGSCGIEDGTLWQKELELKVYLHKNDKNHPWLRMQPDILFGNELEIDSEINIIHTPGHSLGSVCLLHNPSKSLFTGDSIYARSGKLTIDNDLKTRSQGLRVLMNYEFENILPFHYDKVIGGGKNKLEKFLK